MNTTWTLRCPKSKSGKHLRVLQKRLKKEDGEYEDKGTFYYRCMHCNQTKDATYEDMMDHPRIPQILYKTKHKSVFESINEFLRKTWV